MGYRCIAKQQNISHQKKKIVKQHSEITVLISFMTPYPSTSLFCFQSCIFQDGGTKAYVVSISSRSRFPVLVPVILVIFYHLLIVISGN